MHDLVQELVEGLRPYPLVIDGAADATTGDMLRTRVALLLAGSYLAVFTGRTDVASEQERAFRQLLERAAGPTPDPGVIEGEVARGFETLAEFTRPSFGLPLAHGRAVARVAAMCEALGLPSIDAPRAAVHVADLINEYVFKRYWRG